MTTCKDCKFFLTTKGTFGFEDEVTLRCTIHVNPDMPETVQQWEWTSDDMPDGAVRALRFGHDCLKFDRRSMQ